MKLKALFIAIILSLIIPVALKTNGQESKGSATANGNLNIIASPDLSLLIDTWARNYSAANPGINLNVTSLAENKSTAAAINEGKLVFISADAYQTLNPAPYWNMVVGRDVVAPVINADNPSKTEITRQGLSFEELGRVISQTGKLNWGNVVENGSNAPLHFYMVKNASISAMLARLTGIQASLINGIHFDTEKEMIAALRKDPNGIGFCSMSLLSVDNINPDGDLQLMPIDVNNNGKLDYNEQIYDSRANFLRGVWIGKYPKGLCRNIYAVSSIQPKGEAENGLLKWILTVGQDKLNELGYVDLVYSDRQKKQEMLGSNEVMILPNKQLSFAKIALIVLGGFILLGFIVSQLVNYFRRRKAPLAMQSAVATPFLDEHSVRVLNGLYFDKTHTWAFMEEDGRVKLGIDDFLQHITGTLTRVKMKKPGDRIHKGEYLMSIIQNGKQLNIFSPISGIIKENNPSLESNTSLLNVTPYSEGWVYKVEPTDWLSDLQSLLMADKYKTWIKNELTRLKDFLAVSINANKYGYSPVILQDGGMLHDGVLSELGPEVWEDVQTHFLETSK